MAAVGAARGALLLDAGGITALAAGDARARAVLVRARREGRQVAIPTVVLAEVVSGRPADAAADRVLKAVDLELELTGERARHAGALRSGAWTDRRGAPGRAKDERPPSVVDAVVVAEAIAAGGAVVLTSDPDELGLLLDAAGRSGAATRVVGV